MDKFGFSYRYNTAYKLRAYILALWDISPFGRNVVYAENVRGNRASASIHFKNDWIYKDIALTKGVSQMKLIFEKDTQRSGQLVKGYIEKWNWYKENGSYNSGKDFLSAHWEVRNASPYIVRLHVESPKQVVDPKLNAIKNRIIINILAKIFEIQKTTTLGHLKIGTKLSNTYKYKSSEVFQVELTDKNVLTLGTEEKISKVNNEIGHVIDNSLTKCIQEIKEIFCY